MRSTAHSAARGGVQFGCVATGATLQEVETEIREAIEFHIEGMREDGLAIPIPQSKVDYVEVSA